MRIGWKALIVAITAAALIICFSQETVAAKKVDSRPQLPWVHLDGTYFTRNDKRFIPIGAHWVPAKAAMQWPVEWDPKDIEADFKKMHELGYTITRFALMWAWF